MTEDLINRITYHLSSGGLFNPELADHLAVRSLLMECRDALAPPEQEPVAWMTEERYAEMHTSKWTPKIQQVFSKDGILESQTIQYAPQSKTVPYPPAQRTWVGLTPQERDEINEQVYGAVPHHVAFHAAIEAKLKEKNT